MEANNEIHIQTAQLYCRSTRKVDNNCANSNYYLAISTYFPCSKTKLPFIQVGLTILIGSIKNSICNNIDFTGALGLSSDVTAWMPKREIFSCVSRTISSMCFCLRNQ